jgi:hypothetical protein
MKTLKRYSMFENSNILKKIEKDIYNIMGNCKNMSSEDLFYIVTDEQANLILSKNNFDDYDIMYVEYELREENEIDEILKIKENSEKVKFIYSCDYNIYIMLDPSDGENKIIIIFSILLDDRLKNIINMGLI